MSDQETYWYITCKTDNLRSVNGGNAIVLGSTGDNVAPSTLTQRQTIKEISSMVTNRTVALCRAGNIDVGGNVVLSKGLKVSTALKNALQPYLDSSVEWIVDSNPATSPTETNPFINSSSGNGTPCEFQINPNLFTVFIAGDSIDYGVGIKTPTSTEIYTLNFDGADEFHYSRLAMEAVDTNVVSESFVVTKYPTQPQNDTVFYGDKMMINKVAVGGASYANTVGTEDQIDFIHVFNLKYNQLYRTLNLNSNTAILMGFGTNDAAYDTSLTAAELFKIETDAIELFKLHHPQCKIIAVTDIKRTDDTTLNNRIHAFNELRRDPVTGSISHGADYLCDFADPAQTHAHFHPLTGTISTGANGLFADGDVVHPSKLGHYYLSKPLIPIFRSLLNLSVPTLKRVHITNNVIREHSSIGTVVGTLHNFQDTGSTFSLVNNAGGRFSLSGSNVLVNADIYFSEGYKHDITIRETFTGGSGASKDTVINILIGNLAPVYPITRYPLDPALSTLASGRPQITGSPFSGSTLTADNGTWFHTVDSYAVQWKRDGVNFTGTTTYTYLLTDSDVGCEFTFQVIATNSNGSTTNTSLGFMPGPVLATPIVTGSDVALTWTFFNDTNVTDYTVEYKLVDDDKWLVFNNGISAVKSVTITGLATGTYLMKVSAQKGTGSTAKFSKDSNIQTITVS
jgi:hypothetical protein